MKLTVTGIVLLLMAGFLVWQSISAHAPKDNAAVTEPLTTDTPYIAPVAQTAHSEQVVSEADPYQSEDKATTTQEDPKKSEILVQ